MDVCISRIALCALLVIGSVSPALAEEIPDVEPPAAEVSWQITSGGEYLEDATTPAQKVTQTTIPLIVSRESRDTLFELRLPYLQRTAPAGKIAIGHHQESEDESNVTTSTTTQGTNAGLGDIIAALQQRLMGQTDQGLAIFLRGEIKFGTASVEQGLGTGMNDYSLELKARQTLDDLTGILSLGYAMLGSPGNITINEVSRTLVLNNIIFGSAAGNYEWSESVKTEIKVEWAQAAEAGGSPVRDAILALDYKFDATHALRMQAQKSIVPGLDIYGANLLFSFAL